MIDRKELEDSLAKPEDIEKLGKKIQFLTLNAQNGSYGINIIQTHEVLKPISITRLPNVSPEVLGVINLRGSIIPVIDLNKKFGYSFTKLTPLARIIVCTYNKKMMGLLIDRVTEVARITEESVEGVEVSNLSNFYVSGVGRTASSVFLILNLAKIFTYTEEIEEN